MTSPVPLAFYAPLKSPDDPSPSGDRTMARLLMAALAEAGFAPTLASRLRTHEPRGEPARQRALQEASDAEAAAVEARLRALPDGRGPRLWFTYHCYYKAPDWLGPAVAERLRIPYVVAEGTRAAKRAAGPWALAHAGAERALDRARAIFALTPGDRAALERSRPPGQAIVDLPPFLDLEALPPAPEPPRSGPPRLLTVAMMRQGDKLASYRFLSGALARLAGAPWTLDVAGDGPARPEIERLFAFAGPRATFHGRLDDPARLAALHARADLLVWPAVNEAYGMALLEAQAQGCPVLAGRHGGVGSVVRDGITGLLTPPGDVDAFVDVLGACLAAPERLRPMRAAARRFVAEERSLPRAAATLRETLATLVEGAS